MDRLIITAACSGAAGSAKSVIQIDVLNGCGVSGLDRR